VFWGAVISPLFPNIVTEKYIPWGRYDCSAVPFLFYLCTREQGGNPEISLVCTDGIQGEDQNQVGKIENPRDDSDVVRFLDARGAVPESNEAYREFGDNEDGQ